MLGGGSKTERRTEVRQKASRIDAHFGDIDGVLCIPREIAYEVLLRAEGIEKNEVDIFSWVHQGDTISEIIDKGGYF